MVTPKASRTSAEPQELVMAGRMTPQAAAAKMQEDAVKKIAEMRKQ